MSQAQTYFEYALWALQALLLPPLLAVAGVAGLSFILSAFGQNPMRTGRWKQYHWLAAAHLLFFFAAIAVGVTWRNPQVNPTLPHTANAVGKMWLDVITCSSLVSCAFWVWRMKGFRWFAASLMVLLQVPVFAALFVAGMSVSGDWI
jgi:hypothetical protein